MEAPNYHLGHMLMEGLKRKPDFLYQIDAGTGEQMTNAEALSKSVQLARCLRNCNIRPGDVLALSGTNHILLNIPFNAALFNGYPISAIDPQFKYDEIKSLLKITQPKIVFCMPEAYKDYSKAVQALDLNTRIVTYYGKGDTTLSSFIKEFDDNQPDSEFKIAEFDLDKVYAYLTCTSGTTGRLKVAAIKHKEMLSKIMAYIKHSLHNLDVNDVYLNLSPVSWTSAYYCAVSIPYANDCQVMTSRPADVDHVIEMINKYRPKTTTLGPAMVVDLLSRAEEVDLTCFTFICIAGSRCNPDLIPKLKSHMKPESLVYNMYGQTETLGIIMTPVLDPPDSCGKQGPFYELKLVDPDTEVEIKEPNVPGELWCKGICFSEYYNDPEETAKCKTSDGWVKTGDLLYRDERGCYFYVDRMKHLIKYRNYQVHPSEIEDVIRELPAVHDVCVVGVDSAADGQLPTACVVVEDGARVTAQEIKELVASKLSNAKHLRGGVLFLAEFPLTSSGKIRKNLLTKIAMESKRE
ncbi:luciferin 4-monooxygenase-like [Aricia agestis]|uniref:luciferin 4-monooxygenase-like n=1 Tax=Aricia agestis TaxID=91739 RepID=UPI001C201DEE|nr:luciferin 4-monooxygenase-like [Aricia agestis]